MSKTGSRMMIGLLVLCAVTYAIVLQVTGQPVAAEKFVEWSGGGLLMLIVLGWMVGAL